MNGTLRLPSDFSYAVARLLLAIAPALLAVELYKTYAVYTPVWAFYYDPIYIYLLNGMGLVHGFSPGHYDHPGTPVQILTAVILFITWLSTSALAHTADAFDVAVINDPEFYIKVVSIVFIFMNIGANYFLGFRLYRATNNLLVAIFIQSCFLLSIGWFPHAAFLSPEALLLFVGAMLMACLANVLFAPGGTVRDGNVAVSVATGLFVALGLTAKITSLPLLLLVLVLPTSRQRIIAFATFVLCTALILLPILSALPHFARWLTSLAEHADRYGTGPPTVIDLAMIPVRLSLLYQAMPIVFVAFGACLFMTLLSLVRSRFQRSDPSNTSRIWQGIVLCVVVAAQVLMVLKHFGYHYAIPSLSIAPVVLGWALFHGMSPFRLAFQRGMSATAVAFALYFAIVSARTNSRALDAMHQKNETDLAVIQQTLVRHDRALVIGCYRVRERQYAIQFALGYVSPQYVARLSAINQGYSYNRFNNRLSQGTTWLQLNHLNELIAQGREVLVILPPDVTIPQLRGELLTQIPNAERIFRVTHIDD